MLFFIIINIVFLVMWWLGWYAVSINQDKYNQDIQKVKNWFIRS